MALALVAYQLTEAKLAKWRLLVERSGMENVAVVVVENDTNSTKPESWPSDKHWHYVRGSNQYFEFSGYQEALSELEWQQTPGEIESFFLFNDTLFTHHSARNWARILRETKWTPGIHGDRREETVELAGKPLRIFASWHFALVGKEGIDLFQCHLKKALALFDESITGEAYQSYLENYLQGSWLRGYTDPKGIIQNKDLQRKKHCIYAEHRMGRWLEEQVYWKSHPSAHYAYTRTVDRFLALRRRILKRLDL